MLYTIKQFIKSGVHLGHYKWECDYRLSYFLLGIRNSVHIINLYYTLFVLKQGLYIAYNVCMLNQRILVANNIGYKLSVTFAKINKEQLWYINNKWISGLLSNQKEILLNNEKLFLKFYDLGYNSLLPAYVFASNIRQTSSCIFESIILNIPCSALIDSNVGFYGIFYGIPSNDDNFVTIYLFSRLFIKIYLKSIFDNINNLKLLYKEELENQGLLKAKDKIKNKKKYIKKRKKNNNKVKNKKKVNKEISKKKVRNKEIKNKKVKNKKKINKNNNKKKNNKKRKNKKRKNKVKK